MKLLRFTAFWEGVSYLLLLFVCMPLKYLVGWEHAALMTRIVGMAHGFLFVAYVILVLMYANKWGVLKTLLLLLASILPFGTFVAEYKIFKKEEKFF